MERFTDRVSILVLPQDRDHVSLEALLDFLGSKEMRVAMVEAGAALTSAFLNQGLVDECYCYLAPMFLGATAQSGLKLPEPPTLQAAQRFAQMDCKVIADNVLVVLSQPLRLPAVKRTSRKKSASSAQKTASPAQKSATGAAQKAATSPAQKAATGAAKKTVSGSAKKTSASPAKKVTAKKTAPKTAS